MTLPSAIVGGTDVAKLTASLSFHSWFNVVASNAAKRPGTVTHWLSPMGIEVQIIPFLVPFAESELKPPGIPSVGGFAYVPVACSAGVWFTWPVDGS